MQQWYIAVYRQILEEIIKKKKMNTRLAKTQTLQLFKIFIEQVLIPNMISSNNNGMLVMQQHL